MRLLHRRSMLHLTASAAASIFLPSTLMAQNRGLADSFDDPAQQPESVYDPRFDDTSPPTALDPALDRALIEIVTDPRTLNVREVPLRSDWGPEVRKYLEFCGIRRPAWWCAAFVSYQIHQAAERSRVRSSWPRFANCVDIFRWGEKHGLLLAEPGVPSVMLIPGNVARGERRFKHTGFVVGYNPTTRVIETVEGNSNNNGSRNGIGVFRLTRRKSSQRFVRII